MVSVKSLWSGHQAVVLFFVLSGFPLSRMSESMQGRSYFIYCAARIVRLYPAYLISIFLAGIIYWVLQKLGYQWQAGWMNTVKPTLSRELVFDHALMIGYFDIGTINPPIWSLVHEMRLSLIFPLLFSAVRRWSWRTLMLSIVFSGFMGFLTWQQKPSHISQTTLSLLLTMHYATFFLIGSILSQQSKNIEMFFSKSSKYGRCVWWDVSISVYTYPFDNPWTIGERIYGDLLIGIGSIGLVGLIITAKYNWLMALGRPLVKISYSLYLNHYIVLNTVIILFFARLPNLLIWTITFLTSILLAMVMYKIVEAPSLKLSRKFRNIKSSLATFPSAKSATNQV